MIRVNAEAISYDSASDCLDTRKVDSASAVCFAHDSYARMIGAHVQKANSYDNRWYVTPLCRTCNNRTDEFDVFFDLVPVPSNL